MAEVRCHYCGNNFPPEQIIKRGRMRQCHRCRDARKKATQEDREKLGQESSERNKALKYFFF